MNNIARCKELERLQFQLVYIQNPFQFNLKNVDLQIIS